MRDSLPPRAEILLEAAGSEAKRLGRQQVDLIALLVAVERRAGNGEQALDAVFGIGASAKLASSAKVERIIGDEQVVRQVLKEHGEQPPEVLFAKLQADWPELEQLLIGELKGDSSAAQPARIDKEEEDVAPEESGARDAPKPATSVHIPPAELADRLGTRLRGQDDAISQVVRRLAVTRQGLDIRPERPDGAFLFVGPTGVGKTELALALAEELMGDSEALIRLDMSEYAHDWALSRLTGPMPGYVGSDRPESWLTTRVIKAPNSVVLLDEVEKAHPAVWNIFLQALDAGRLTDSRGKTADFSQTIFIMTSNIGAEVFTEHSLGFVRASDQSKTERETQEATSVHGSVLATLPPELINRLDAIITFRALGQAEISEIAELDLSRLVERMQARGLNLKLESGVGDFIARANYDRRFGARHLQRNIELLLIEPLALQGLTSGTIEVKVADGGLVFARTDK